MQTALLLQQERSVAILQVRDVPDELYESLSIVAKKENRSISQETIVLLKQALQLKEERILKRKALLEELSSFKNSLKNINLPDPATLIREDRDR